MCDNSFTTSTDEQRMLALAKTNNRLFAYIDDYLY